jgi:hypothetical protein
MRKKLTKTQKRKNQKLYEKIRQGYNKVKDKNKLITYKQFKNRVQAQMEANPGMTANRAIQKVQNTETFTTAAERSRTNFLESLKEKWSDTMKEIRNLSRTDTGKFKKVELTWTQVGDKWGYSFSGQYGKKYFIDVSNSPEEVFVYEI